MPTKRAREVHLNPLHHEHIAPEYLPNVNTYKYSGVDNSILSRFVMQYYWTAAVELLPMWLAPNVVTLLGFIISASSTLLVLGFDIIDRWGFDGSLRGSIPAGEYPSWVWYYAAIALFAYQTLDALDGKQARRTKSGSPMGELFDHGCDAFFTPLLQVNLCVALGLTPSVRFVFFLLVTSGLLFAIWEQFVTGTLDFGYITGPTEGILLTCWIFWATGYYGPAIWATPLTSFALHWSSPAFAIGSLQIPSYPLVAMSTWGDALFYLTVTAVILTVIGNVAHVITRPRVKSHPFGVSITSLAPNVVVVVMFVWYQCTFEQVSLQAPFMVELCYGFLASYTATRLTVSRLCGMPYRPISTFYVATVLCVGLPAAIARIMPDVVNAKDPSTCSILISLLYILLATGIAQYAHLIVSVFKQLSTFLKIDIFKVKKQQ